MLKLKRIASAFLFAVMTTTAVVAQQPAPATQTQSQQDFSDAELKNFANVYQKIQMLSQNMLQQMAQVVQDEGMDVQRFNEIHQAQMTPGQEPDATPEETKLHSQIVPKIEKMQMDFEKEIAALMEHENITIEKYQQIVNALQSDPQLQTRLQKLMQS